MILPPCQRRHKIKGFHWVVQHIFVVGDFTGRQTCLYGLLHLCFSLTHSGKCRAGDSHSLISRFSVETPEAVGGPRLERSLFCLCLPRLSMETWSLRSLWSVCGDFKKEKNKGVQHFSKYRPYPNKDRIKPLRSIKSTCGQKKGWPDTRGTEQCWIILRLSFSVEVLEDMIYYIFKPNYHEGRKVAPTRNWTFKRTTERPQAHNWNSLYSQVLLGGKVRNRQIWWGK